MKFKDEQENANKQRARMKYANTSQARVACQHRPAILYVHHCVTLIVSACPKLEPLNNIRKPVKGIETSDIKKFIFHMTKYLHGFYYVL